MFTLICRIYYVCCLLKVSKEKSRAIVCKILLSYIVYKSLCVNDLYLIVVIVLLCDVVFCGGILWRGSVERLMRRVCVLGFVCV